MKRKVQAVEERQNKLVVHHSFRDESGTTVFCVLLMNKCFPLLVARCVCVLTRLALSHTFSLKLFRIKLQSETLNLQGKGGMTVKEKERRMARKN